MCKFIIVHAETEDGAPHPDAPEFLDFDPPEDFTPEYPTCTCWIGKPEGDGVTLRQTFVEECLRPFLERVSYGNIIISIRY